LRPLYPGSSRFCQPSFNFVTFVYLCPLCPLCPLCLPLSTNVPIVPVCPHLSPRCDFFSQGYFFLQHKLLVAHKTPNAGNGFVPVCLPLSPLSTFVYHCPLCPRLSPPPNFCLPLFHQITGTPRTFHHRGHVASQHDIYARMPDRHVTRFNNVALKFLVSRDVKPVR
jgi:hypothetical protein